MRAQRSGSQLKRKKKPASCSFRREAKTERCWLLLMPWCRWPDSNRHALRHLILSYLLHTEHRRTQPPVEVVAGHLKALQILLFLKLICRKAPFRLPFSLFSIWTEFLDFGGTSEGCYPQTEHNSTRSRFINHKYIIAYFSAIDNILSEKEVSL